MNDKFGENRNYISLKPCRPVGELIDHDRCSFKFSSINPKSKFLAFLLSKKNLEMQNVETTLH